MLDVGTGDATYAIERTSSVGSLLCADRSMFAAEEFFRQAVIGVVYRTISGCLLKSAGLTRATGQAARMRRRGRQRVSRRRERRPLQYSRARSRSGRGRWFTSRCWTTSRIISRSSRDTARLSTPTSSASRPRASATASNSTSTHGRARMVFYRLTSDVIFHPTPLDFSSVQSLVSDRLETLRRP